MKEFIMMMMTMIILRYVSHETALPCPSKVSDVLVFTWVGLGIYSFAGIGYYIHKTHLADSLSEEGTVRSHTRVRVRRGRSDL